MPSAPAWIRCSIRCPDTDRELARQRARSRVRTTWGDVQAAATITLLSDTLEFLELCGEGCSFLPSDAPYYPQNASWANFAWIRAKTTRRKAPRIAFLGSRHPPVPGESAGVSADTGPRSRRRHLKRLWSCRSRRPPRSTRGGFSRSQLLGLGAAPI